MFIRGNYTICPMENIKILDPEGKEIVGDLYDQLALNSRIDDSYPV